MNASFSFEYLWKIALAINASNPDSNSLTHPLGSQSRICLTYDACVAAVGSNYVYYSRRDVYDRILLWRVPLIALVATTTLPALEWHTQLFTIVHLIADPIDTLWSLFYKIDLARRHADWAKKTNNEPLSENGDGLFTFIPEKTQQPPEISSRNDRVVRHDLEVGSSAHRKPILKRIQTGMIRTQSFQDKDQELPEGRNKAIEQYELDVVALIVDAYQEWHYGLKAKSDLKDCFGQRWPLEIRERFRCRCQRAAAYIAADRVSRILPSSVATLVFFIQIFAAFWKTLGNLGDRPDPSNYASSNLNRTPHNIAFGALYFWLPFAVLATAIVGGAQTQNSVARILIRLREDAREIYLDQSTDRKGPDDLPNLKFSMPERRIAGGLPTWQLDKFDDWADNDPKNLKFFVGSLLLAVIIVAIPTTTAIYISCYTPTEGIGCRAVTQFSFFASWIFSCAADWILSKLIRQPKGDGAVRSQWIYWITFVKDFLLTSGAVILLTFSALGILNSCNCWTKWWPFHSAGKRYLSFPQEQFVFDTIKRKLSFDFAIATGIALGAELLIFFAVWVYFHHGYRVLSQRDIEDILSHENWQTRFKNCMRRILRLPWAHLSRNKKLSAKDKAPKDDGMELRRLLTNPRHSGDRPPLHHPLDTNASGSESQTEQPFIRKPDPASMATNS